MKRILSFVICIVLLLPWGNSLTETGSDEFERIATYLDAVTQDTVYNKIHFYNENSDHEMIDSKQELQEATEAMIVTAERYNAMAMDAESALTDEEDSTSAEEICITVQFDSDYFKTDEFIAFSEERNSVRSIEDVRDFRRRLNDYSKEYHAELVRQKLPLASGLDYYKAEIVGYAPFVNFSVLPENLTAEALLEVACSEDVLNISLSCASQIVMETAEVSTAAAEGDIFPTVLNGMSQTMIDGIHTGEGVRIGVYEANENTTGSLSHVNLADKDITMKDSSDPITSHLVSVTSVIATIAPDAEYYIDVINDKTITLEWFLDEVCDVVNCSFGNSGYLTYDYGRDGLFDYQILAHYISFVVSAGNYNATMNPQSRITSPGYAYNAITVGGVDLTYVNSAYRWMHAERACYVTPNQQSKPNLSAAYTLNIPNIGVKTGTSFSAPQVTGAIALLQGWDYIYSLSPERALAVVVTGAEKTYDFSASENFNDKIGWGILNMDRMFEVGANYVDGSNNNDYTGNIVTKQVYVTAGKELQAGLCWLITADPEKEEKYITDYDLKIYSNLYGQPVATSSSSDSNTEVVRYTPQFSGSCWIVVTQNDPINDDLIKYDYYSLSYLGASETP